MLRSTYGMPEAARWSRNAAVYGHQAVPTQARLSNHHFGAFLRLQKPSFILWMPA
jgi:hypothetical protein